MSVAFRRESDEEHKEPRFELPIPPGPNFVTPRGLTQIAARIEDLRAAVAAATDEDARALAERDLRYWSTRETTAELAPPASGEAVAIGTRVTFRLNGAEREIEIVGFDESDPAAGRIAFSAPLARAMIGAEEGETVEFGGKADAIEIVAITSV
ncbi:GreA/GreB family elongation factor [Sphingomonas sp. NFR15]|uniref:GreA/GreB family elongation factor n=1 Tax=Sphingomonas sp. NFR15 TaxID=1566282 RepID=UPI000881A9EE|nr:GreA/GreB family elongation factor [Sphingomonas sp. NFR15]SDA21029.1 Transcription elongation factor, GreA/GreB family [Sphingomonas sp. NFR15]